jgi:hypothetical protein
MSAPVIMNNVIAYNGGRVGGSIRGRGICDFSNNRALIHHNNFSRNLIAAILRGGRDWRFIEALERRNEDPNVVGNIDGPPRFLRRPHRLAERNPLQIFLLRDNERSRALNNGNPDPACNNLDGTRNTMGFTGGAFPAGSTAIPNSGACGVP